MWLSACIGGIFLPLRMTVYIRFKPSHLPGSLETKGHRDHVDYYHRTQDQLFRRLGVIIAACMYPGTIAGMPASSCAFTIGEGRMWPHDEILSSCRRGTCSVATFSSGLPRRLAVVCLLGLDGIAACVQVVHAGGKHGFLGLARVC